MNKIKNCVTIEIVTATGQTKYNLPSVTTFRDKLVNRVEAHSVSQIAKSPLNVALIPDSALKTAYLTLAEGSNERVKDLPLIDIVPGISMGVTTSGTVQVGRVINDDIGNIEPMIVNHDKSYVTIADSSTISAGTVILLTFYYQDQK